MSSGQWKRHDGFNKTQIKDGWVVNLRKDGTVRSKIQKWIPGAMNKDAKKQNVFKSLLGRI